MAHIISSKVFPDKYIVRIITLFLFAGFLWYFLFKNIRNDNGSYANILVTKVIDGDTIRLENKERVRLIGIDAPEYHVSNKLWRDSRRLGKDAAVIQQMGHQSYQHLKSLIEGKRVKLEFDLERYDKYQRLLGYVYTNDGVFVNAKMVEDGYASVYTFVPNVKYSQLFLKFQSQSREEKRGLWKEDEKVMSKGQRVKSRE